MRSQTGSATEISVFPTEISVTGKKVFQYEHSDQGDQDKTFLTNLF